MFEARWDEGLDEAQLAAATHGDGPLIVVAGAGTGKTRTLVARVAALLDRGVEPERILLLTFTRRAAEEMLSRAAAACERRDVAGRLWGGTFHAVAYRLVAEHAEALGQSAAVSVLDPGDAHDLMDLLRHEYGLAGNVDASARSERQRAPQSRANATLRFPRGETLLDIYSRAVNTGVPARDVIAAIAPWCTPHTDAILELFRGYVARKRERSLMDFDDLLLGWRALLSDPALGPAIAGRWDHVLVDEYQDVNQIQVDIVRRLCPDGVGLTVVGDDAQAIYGFRGADSRHLIALRDDLPATRTVCLERNFRSRQRILDLANVVRPDGGGPRLRLRSARDGGPRPRLVRCPDTAAEARAVVDAVLDALDRGRRLRTQAVLMRAAHHSDLLEVELTSRGVPFVKYGGLKFLEAAHVKDFIAGVRLLDNPRDELAWFRLLRLHDGVGPARARGILDALRVTEDDDPTPRHPEAVAVAPAASRTALAATLEGLAATRARAGVGPRAEGVLDVLRPLLTARYPDHPARLGDLDRLVAAAAGSPTLAEYVANLTLDPPASTSDLAGAPSRDEDWLTLSTVHSAKGLEWDIVHVIHAVDGAFPSDMALGSAAGLIEEKRLFYVAVTRAREELAVYTPLRMPHHRRGLDDRHSYAPASRFLDEAALATMDIHEHRRPAAAAVASPAGARVDLPTLSELFE